MKIVESSSGLNPIVNQVDLGMINPKKIRESSFITDFLQSRVSEPVVELDQGKKSRTVMTQTEIKGRIYDEVDDEVLDEIINTSMMNIGYTDQSEYEITENLKNDKSHLSLWNQRRRSDNAIEKNSESMSNRSSRPNLGPVSSRISLQRKQKKFNVGTGMNSSVVFTRRNVMKLDLEDKALNEDYSADGLSLRNLEHQKDDSKNIFAK